MSFKNMALAVAGSVVTWIVTGEKSVKPNTANYGVLSSKFIRVALDSVLHHVEYQELRDVDAIETFLREEQEDYMAGERSDFRGTLGAAARVAKKVDLKDWHKFHCFLRGLAAAAHAHEYAARKSTGYSYLVHPVRMVISLLLSGVEDVEILVAALLHDTVEDSGVTIGGIQTMFEKSGYPRVHSIVAEVTDDRSHGTTREMRKRAQLSHAPHLSEGARLVKSVDMWDNLRSIFEHGPPSKWTVAYTQGYFLWKYEIFKLIQGVNTEVDMALQYIFEMERFTLDGVQYPVLPEDTSVEALEAYFGTC